MDDNTKSLIKQTLLGLMLGGSAASAYSLFNEQDGTKDGKEEADNRIVVPLSKSHFMKAVRSAKNTAAIAKEPPSDKATAPEAAAVEKKPVSVSGLTPQELAAFKKAILRRRAEFRKSAEKLPQQIGKTESAISTSTNICSRNGVMTAQDRDASGRFAGTKRQKTAGDSMWDNITGKVYDYAGLGVGMLAGTAAAKALYERIAINRKKREVESARRIYTKLLNREVSDTDEPYYKGAEDHRTTFENAAGSALSVGVGTAALSALVMYKILDNRRKALEREADKDTSRFPKDKSIEFKFV